MCNTSEILPKIHNSLQCADQPIQCKSHKMCHLSLQIFMKPHSIVYHRNYLDIMLTDISGF